MTMPTPHAPLPAPLRRRAVLALSWATLLGLPAAPSARAQQPAPNTTGGRLIVVFLRGAYDGLSAAVPYADPNYYRLRPRIAIAAPDGTPATALKLDGQFALHPSLAPLMPLWQQGVMTFLPAVGLPVAIRSHFEAQHYWEIGQPGKNSADSGWLNTLARFKSAPRGGATVLGVGEANPEILRGAAPARLVARGQAATRTGVLGNDGARQALMDMYASSDTLGPAFRQGAASRMDTARALDEGASMGNAQMGNAQMTSAQMLAANNGAGNPAGLLLDARHLATLMRQDPGLQLGFLSAGGWDTHANQGNATGALAQNFTNLAAALAHLRGEFSRPDDVIAVVSEFGRTCAENGTRGTDHGHGNALWLIGSRVQGGRPHGRWEGLAPGQLNEGRDLPVLHDFRAVLSLVLRGTQGVSDAQLAAVFPGNPFAGQALASGDNRALAGLLRA